MISPSTNVKKSKGKCEKAKEMNFANDGDFIWRIRGSPRTSLRFVKAPRSIPLYRSGLYKESPGVLELKRGTGMFQRSG